jgi:hypothetical protein
MDRSFLSQTEVIKASRSFICVRLATYEDEAEAKLLKGLTRTGSGELENSVVAVLSSDGKRHLARSGRSPRNIAWSATGLGKALDKIVKDNPSKSAPSSLPLVANVKLAVNVASCDNLPLVVLHAGTPKERRELEAAVARLAWKPAFVGRFTYASADGAKALKGVPGGKSGLTVVQPSKFGTDGKALVNVSVGSDEKQLLAALEKGLKLHKRDNKTFRNHVREGHLEGVFWETPTPVTDPMEKAARERGRRKR